MKRTHLTTLATVAFAFCCNTALASEYNDGAVLVTNPEELRAMGESPDAANVWKLPGTGRTDDTHAKAEFGTTERTHTPIAAKAFQGRESDFEYTQGSNSGIQCASTSPEEFADAQISLPHGASLDGVRWWVNNSSADQDAVLFVFERCYPDFNSADVTTTQLASSTISASAGNATDFVSTGDRRIDHTSCHYLARVRFTSALGSCDEQVELQKLRLQWFRDLGPAPATATFSDVSTGHPFFQHVENLVASGITAGCGGGNYCPGDPLTRGQMAVFLSKALGLYWNEDIADPAN